MKEFIDLVTDIYESVEKMEKESYDSSAKFFAAKIKTRIENFRAGGTDG